MRNPALDFVGTLRARRNLAPTEMLDAPSSLDAWFRVSGVVEGRTNSQLSDLPKAIELREAIYSLVAARRVRSPEPRGARGPGRPAAHPRGTSPRRHLGADAVVGRQGRRRHPQRAGQGTAQGVRTPGMHPGLPRPLPRVPPGMVCHEDLRQQDEGSRLPSPPTGKPATLHLQGVKARAPHAQELSRVPWWRFPAGPPAFRGPTSGGQS